MTDDGIARPLDWEETAAALAADRPWLSPAELHGLLCGSVCADGIGPGDDAWLQRIWQHVGEDIGDAVDHGELVTFRLRAAANLDADDFGFLLLLPSEEAPLQDRVAALASWCGGFLSGFGLAGGRTDGLEDDAAEALEDMAAICHVDEAVDGAEAEESDYAELTEYVRMGVLLVLSNVRGEGRGEAPEELE
jgi:uncharacterized protein YgfB (UPF0149 family)